MGQRGSVLTIDTLGGSEESCGQGQKVNLDRRKGFRLCWAMARGFRFEYPGALYDSDYDGLFDWHELLLGLNPYSPDSDSDGLPDAWELAHGFDPHNPADGLAAGQGQF